MGNTQHLGFGRFRLEDLLPGETFARFDGSLAKVCKHQPYRSLNPITKTLLLPDHFLVWTDWGTSNAVKVLLHRTALVHALSPEQAREIQQRINQRKENPCV